MPFHSKKTLEHWVAEFVEARSAGEEIRVAVQDGTDGHDTGLVVMPLVNAPNALWIEPRDSGEDLRWKVLIEAADRTLELTSFELNGLTHELQIAAELCAFLEEKSIGHYETNDDSEREAGTGATPVAD